MHPPYAKKSHRIEQLNSLLQQKLSGIIAQKLELPEGVIVTVTHMRVSKDIRHARAFLSIYPTEKTNPIFALIRRKLNYIQYLLHHGLTTKFSPELTVSLDRSENTAAELEAVLYRIKKKHNV